MGQRTREHSPIIYTNRAACRDCYRCVRVCPVKAIRMRDGQAQVIEERCVYCGTCVRECPQKAKHVRDDTAWAEELLARGGKVAASVAPTYAAAFVPHERARLASALRRLGFSIIAETAVGAAVVAKLTKLFIQERGEGAYISSACPAVVRYVERYAPQSVPNLMPVVSPMIAHAHLLREQHKADAVVFIGPCIAKKFEAERREYENVVDCVITFEELRAWLDRAGISFNSLEESRFDEEAPAPARAFPVTGGQLYAADVPAEFLDGTVCAISGVEDLRESLTLVESGAHLVVEPLYCSGGCIGGPAMATDANLFERRIRVLEHVRSAARDNNRKAALPYDAETLRVETFRTKFSAAPVETTPVSEDAIRRALAKIGKLDPRDQLNCGACGYNSCRDKAIAVVRGLAQPEMCMPYMRFLAERRTDRIIETSPNGIVILDRDLRILAINPAFQKMFLCSEAVLGRPISYLTDAKPFEDVASGVSPRVERTTREIAYGRVFHQIVYGMPEDGQIVGIFVDITESTLTREKLTVLHEQALARSRELLDHQIRMAQDITRLLAENTARGEELVKNLIDIAVVEAPSNPSSSRE